MISRFIRWIAAGILVVASSLACASDAAAWVLKASAPGMVTVSGQLAEAGLQRGLPRGLPNIGDLRLRLPDGSDIPASAIARSAGPGQDVWLALCLDHSGSMSSAFRDLQDGLAAAVRGALSSPDARLRIQTMAFASEVRRVGGFSGNPEELAVLVAALPGETARDGRTRLYDAIAAALADLRSAPAAATRRLLVVSDGKDEGSTAVPDDIARDAAALAVPLDAIAYGALAPDASAPLRALAQASHGQFVLARNPAELTLAMQNLLGWPAPAQVDVVFRYAPAQGQTLAGSATLVHAPAGRAPAEYPVRLDSPISAPMEPGSAGFAPEAVAAALAAAALAVIGCLVLWKGRGKRDVDTSGTAEPTEPPDTAAAASGDASGRRRRNTVVAGSFAPPDVGRPSAYLLCTDGQLQGQRLPIEQALVRLGAGPANELVLGGDEHVSREHASIRHDAGNLYLQDLHSANGTYLNDQRLGGSAMTLLPGDRIRLGRTTLLVQAADTRQAATGQPQRAGRQPTLVRTREDSQR